MEEILPLNITKVKEKWLVTTQLYLRSLMMDKTKILQEMLNGYENISTNMPLHFIILSIILIFFFVFMFLMMSYRNYDNPRNPIVKKATFILLFAFTFLSANKIYASVEQNKLGKQIEEVLKVNEKKELNGLNKEEIKKNKQIILNCNSNLIKKNELNFNNLSTCFKALKL